MIGRLLPFELKLSREFIVAGGRTTMKRNHLVILDESGLGEASGSVHYGKSSEEVEEELREILDEINSAVKIEDIPEFLESKQGAVCPPALCALSTAWHDWQGKRSGRKLHEIFGLPSPRRLKTSVTVSVGDFEAIGQWLEAGYDIIKIKMDADSATCEVADH